MLIVVENLKKYKKILCAALIAAGLKNRDKPTTLGLIIHPSRNAFNLKDSWFGGKAISIETVAAALQQHCGITVTISLKNSKITVTSVIVTNEDQYKVSVQQYIAAIDRKIMQNAIQAITEGIRQMTLQDEQKDETAGLLTRKRCRPS